MRNESKGKCWFAVVGFAFWRSTMEPFRLHVSGVDYERIRWDPKDGELCLSRMKPEETLVEVRNDSDVQIDRQTLV